MTCDKCGVCDECGISKSSGTGNGKSADHLEHGFKKFWRPIAAYIYLGICVFDFVGMPLFIEIQNQQVNIAAFEEVRKIEDKDVQIKALEQLDLGSSEWQPLTLLGGGLFHLAFGAILGVAAYTRGQEKVSAIQKG